jgi:predicted DNA-binding transcriptional regulator AlpA
MTINMTDSHASSVAQIKAFLKVDSGIRFKAVLKKEMYSWINDALTKFRYFSLKKKDRGIVRRYITLMTGLSKSQVDRLISKKKKFGIVFLSSTIKHRFPRKYAPKDIALLVKTDNAHKRLSGPATKKILEREYTLFSKEDYNNISSISCSHIYNLRETRQYRSHSITVKKTNPTKVSIGDRRKPDPEGKPGYLRVDTVHQGDYEKKKGIYHINITDEVVQWEVVGAVEKISEYYLHPLLEEMINQFPFKIINFHSDNGSEYINKVVAKLLNKLLILQTKSRARHCNDNALAESKNGAIIRKNIGYVHIPSKCAPAVNHFYKIYFNKYLNYHRPCGYAMVITDKKGKAKKVYPPKDYDTPYEKLKSLNNAKQYLKENISFEMLDKIAYEMSDNDFAQVMRKAKEEVFKNLKHIPFEMISFNTFISHAYVD